MAGRNPVFVKVFFWAKIFWAKIFWALHLLWVIVFSEHCFFLWMRDYISMFINYFGRTSPGQDQVPGLPNKNIPGDIQIEERVSGLLQEEARQVHARNAIHPGNCSRVFLPDLSVKGCYGVVVLIFSVRWIRLCAAFNHLLVLFMLMLYDVGRKGVRMDCLVGFCNSRKGA